MAKEQWHNWGRTFMTAATIIAASAGVVFTVKQHTTDIQENKTEIRDVKTEVKAELKEVATKMDQNFKAVDLEMDKIDDKTVANKDEIGDMKVLNANLTKTNETINGTLQRIENAQTTFNGSILGKIDAGDKVQQDMRNSITKIEGRIDVVDQRMDKWETE